MQISTRLQHQHNHANNSNHNHANKIHHDPQKNNKEGKIYRLGLT